MQYNNKPKEVQYNIISDIVMLFTLLGNDFLPKIEKINTNKHIKNIFDSYIKLNIVDTFIFKSNIDWKLLKEFFINLNSSINQYHNEFYRRTKDWTISPDQILNNNAISYYTHIFNIENLTNIYEPALPTNNKSEYSNKIIERLTRKYLQGFIWLEKYYLEHNFDYKLFYYKYDIAPTINQLISTIDKILKSQLILNKILLNLEKTIPKKYFTPQIQLIYISANNISNIIDNKYLTKELESIINSYDKKFNKELNLVIDNYKINLFDYLDCSNAIFLSKCHIKKDESINKILDYLLIFN